MKDFCVEKDAGKNTGKVQQAPLELKVCEGCGALWLRAVEQGVYCRSCAGWLADFPVLRPEGRRGRRRKRLDGKRRGSGPGVQKVVPVPVGGAR